MTEIHQRGPRRQQPADKWLPSNKKKLRMFLCLHTQSSSKDYLPFKKGNVSESCFPVAFLPTRSFTGDGSLSH